MMPQIDLKESSLGKSQLKSHQQRQFKSLRKDLKKLKRQRKQKLRRSKNAQFQPTVFTNELLPAQKTKSLNHQQSKY